jgi:hypothetical protein
MFYLLKNFIFFLSVCCCLITAQFTISSYPDPRTDPIGCRIILPGFVCDPNEILTPEDRQSLNDKIQQVYIFICARRQTQGCQEHLFKISKSDFKNQILGAKMSKMLIIRINWTKFRISKIRFDTEKSAFCQIFDISKSADLAPLNKPYF